MVLIHKGKQLVLAGERSITAAIKQRVLGRSGGSMKITIGPGSFLIVVTRMMNWVKVANTILETEFPSFGILIHFAAAMKLNPKLDKLPQPNIVSLKALASAFKVDKDTCILHYRKK